MRTIQTGMYVLSMKMRSGAGDCCRWYDGRLSLISSCPPVRNTQRQSTADAHASTASNPRPDVFPSETSALWASLDRPRYAGSPHKLRHPGTGVSHSWVEGRGSLPKITDQVA